VTRNRFGRLGRWAVPAATVLAAVVAAGATPVVGNAAVSGLTYGPSVRVAAGVGYQTFQLSAAAGHVRGYLVSADLRDPRVRVGLLHPDSVGERAAVSAMADAQHAVAGVNGDFFNISEEHAGVTPTGSSDGPEIADGRDLKAAVPNSQRFGPGLPAGTSTRDVIGVGLDRRARLGTLTLRGTAWTGHGALAVGGLNQYAVAQGGIDAFTSAWGTVSRQRAVCGSDLRRADPCATDTAEVVVSHGRVASVSDTPGAGAIPTGSTVLVGREAGADSLRARHVGDPVLVGYHLASTTRVPYAFAVGGFPILRDGAPLAGLDDKVSAVRTAAGYSADGRHFYLVGLAGDAETGAGLTIGELAALMSRLGAADAVNLDGGGSTTVAVREPGDSTVTVENHPSGGAERPVANGVGIFG
jgi:hypothetical protein